MFVLVEFCSKNKKLNYYLYMLIFGYMENILKKINVNKNSKTKFSVLKSPHVHKTSQQQVEEKYYKKKILFVLFNNVKLLIVFKKLFSSTFQDLGIKYSFIHERRHGHFLFDIKFLKLNIYRYRLNINHLSNYFKVLNCLGRSKSTQ
jgi:hypothetical protein